MIQRLLLVDDDAALCRSLSAALTEEGSSVTTAATGLLGLRRFEAAPPDLAILDVLLPEIFGAADDAPRSGSGRSSPRGQRDHHGA